MEQRFVRLFSYLKSPLRFCALSVVFSLVVSVVLMQAFGFDASGLRAGIPIAVVCSATASYVVGYVIFGYHALIEEKNRELARAIADLEQRNADLEAFGHTVAHDLKSPVALISGYAEMLQYRAGGIDGETDAMLDYIWHAGDKMSEIIDSLLTLASISSEEIRLQPVDMRQVAGQALERLSPQIEAAGATLDLPESWPTVVGHAPWIEEMWVNYISNALKYGGSPPVLSLGAEHQPDGAFMFWVRDNGPGIPLDDQPTLFEEFSRLDNHVSGHGLGLSIVRRIALKLGGDVGVRSAAGAGSCFFFSLPAAVEQQRADGVLVN